MILQNQKLKLTEKEINMIIYLSDSKKPIKVNELQEKVWDTNQSWRLILLKHIFIGLEKNKESSPTKI